MATKKADVAVIDEVKDADLTIDENPTGEKPETQPEDQTEPKPAKTDFLKLMGKNLHLDKAKRIFGAGDAFKAMHVVSKAGSHGMFTDDHFKHEFFGGLQIPHVTRAMESDPEESVDQIKHIEKIRSKINSALNSAFPNFAAKNQPDGE